MILKRGFKKRILRDWKSSKTSPSGNRVSLGLISGNEKEKGSGREGERGDKERKMKTGKHDPYSATKVNRN